MQNFASETAPTIYGVSPSAKLGKNLKLAPFVYIADSAIIEDDVIIETGAVIYENTIVGRGSIVGAQCILGERAADYHQNAKYKNPPLIVGQGSVLRSGTIIYAGCTVGARFQTGHRAVIRARSLFGDDCSFGTLSQSDGDIRVGNNCRFHNNVFIATFTTIEDNVHFYPMSCTVDSLHPPCQKGRAGPYIESGVIVGAHALLLPRIRIGTGAVIAGASVVTHDVPPDMVVAGAPARVIKNKFDVRCHIENRPAYEVARGNDSASL
jgi:acetyltransferase-like isoleucine patch superfamily enzyme